MMKRLICLTVALAFCLAGSAYAADIILISDAAVPGTDPGGNHIDDSLVAWLQDVGYTVDTSGMAQAYREGKNPFDDPAKVAALNSAGMVIVSRMASSGDYDSDRKDWNELENPLLLMSGYITRGEAGSKRWGWTTGDSADASLTETDVKLMGLVTVDTFFDWSTAPTPGTCPKGVYLPKKDGTSEFDSEAIILATFDDYAMMVLMEAGTDFDALNGTVDKYGIAGEARGLMGHWGYDLDAALYGWDSFITDGYKEALAEMIGTLIPEPATIALLGLGGLTLLGVRKKR